MNARSHPPQDAAPLVLHTGRRSRTISVLALLIGICGTCGLVLAIADQIARGSSGLVIGFALAGVLVIGVVAKRTGMSGASGHLRIDADGAASWRPASPSPSRDRLDRPLEQRCGAPAFQPLAWFCFLGIVWITGQCGGNTVRLLLARDGLADVDWVRLRRWLRWLDRGGHATVLSSSEAPASTAPSSDVPRLKGRA